MTFPFSALVGLDTLKLALQLAVIDHRVSVLLRGDKGAGKSTAARALADLLPDGSTFVNLPIGATEDRVLGGLDLERAVKGTPALRRGLLSEAHGGLLYVDEVNLLPDHLADTILDAVASGVHIVEREGFSVREDTAFVLVGSMNPEEGRLRPQLLDRFALVVDVSAPMDPAVRRSAVERRLAFDADARAFARDWRDAQQSLARTLTLARALASSVVLPSPLLNIVSERVCAHGVRSLRADLAVVRASRALAALDGAATVTIEHIETVLPLALHHRAPAGRQTPPPHPPMSAPPLSDGRNERQTSAERVFEPRVVSMAPVAMPATMASADSASAHSGSMRRGGVVRARSSASPEELDLRATLVQAIGSSGEPRIAQAHWQEKVRASVGRRRYLFLVDSSGSHGAHRRMELVKGAVAGLLDSSVRRHDEVAVIVFRGANADVLVHPTGDVDQARAALTYVPTGGRTPLAHALEMAAGLITDDTALILLTDGRANVPYRTADAWADAIDAASRITCSALVIDSETGPNPTGRARELATYLRGTYVTLDGI